MVAANVLVHKPSHLHPLCGIGVTSRINSILILRITLNATSLPRSGPFIMISACCMPWSDIIRITFPVIVWAAKGVSLRIPLNPQVLVEEQEITQPRTSVIITIVLLKLAWTWIIPFCILRVWLYELIHTFLRKPFLGIYFAVFDYFNIIFH